MARPWSASSFGGAARLQRPQSAPAQRGCSSIGVLRAQFEALESEAKLLRAQIQEQEQLMQKTPTHAIEKVIFNVKKQLRELMDWSLHAAIRQKRYVSTSSVKAQESGLFRREVRELRAACEYLGNLNLSMTKNPDITLIEKKLGKIAKQFRGIAADLREQTEKREEVADVFGSQLDAVDANIQKLWDLTKTMAAHKEDCERLLKNGRQQVDDCCKKHAAIMENVKVQVVKLHKTSQTAKKFHTLRVSDEAAIEEARQQYEKKITPMIKQNRSLLKVTQQKEKEADVLRNQNEQLIHALQTYQKLCDTAEMRAKKAQHDKDKGKRGIGGSAVQSKAEAKKRPQSAAPHSSHHSNKGGRAKASH